MAVGAGQAAGRAAATVQVRAACASTSFHEGPLDPESVHH